MELIKCKKKKVDGLKTSLSNLIKEYQQSRDLINNQIQAVISSDLARLDSLIEEQLSKYESLEALEEDFKKKLRSFFKDYDPECNHYSLSLMMENLEKPCQELNRLRDGLRDQVEKTQKMRNQLMNLLQFASNHNVETFEGIFKISNENSASYGADGQKRQSATGSLAINQQA